MKANLGTVNWDNRLRDGILYSLGSGLIVLLGVYDETDYVQWIEKTVGFLFLLGVWCFVTVQAINRLFPSFFGDGLEYEQYKLKKDQHSSRDAPLTANKQPSQEDFWRDAREKSGSPSVASEAMTSLPLT